MDLDDDLAFKKATPHGVAGAALFPVMNAIDSLVVTHHILERVPHVTPFNHHSASVMSLCRTAFESASQSIWILSPADRNQRKRRAAGAAMVGAGQKSSHLRVELAHDDGKHDIPEPYLSHLRSHRTWADQERDRLTKINRESDSFSNMVTKSGKWLAENRPAHITEFSEVSDLTTRIDQQYRLCSSFTHGYSWATDFCRSIGDIGAMLADALAVTVFITESAVCLYEAQATAVGSNRVTYHPQLLQPTINEWTELYKPT